MMNSTGGTGDAPRARRLFGVVLLVVLVLATGKWNLASTPAALTAAPAASPSPPTEAPGPPGHVSEAAMIREALLGLAVAGALGSALAFRPVRRGTPPRTPAVIQTQIILALVGALVMIVVGASLARAFGIVGAASLVRYRAKVDDPKDAGVMLACLALGLASGVGIYTVAALSALLILAVVWGLESLAPEGGKTFHLHVKAQEADKLQQRLEELFRRQRVRYELRTSSKDDLTYSVELPFTKRTDRLTSAIVALDGREQMEVEWSERKPGKDKA
jgi:uncharacterized membrane protein YhiD involved in acid resistance